MKINKITIDNFRCFEHLDFEPHPRLNVFVGINGSGKTALMEAIKIAVGSFFLGIDSEYTPVVSISRDDIRYSKYATNLERIPPVSITATGCIDKEESIKWSRGLEKDTKYAKTTRKHAKAIEIAAWQFSKMVQNNTKNSELPLIASYGTDRLCGCKQYSFNTSFGSRFRGYAYCMESSRSQEFQKWFYEQELAYLQSIQQGNNQPPLFLNLMKQIISQCIPDCDTLYSDVKTKEIILKYKDGSRQFINTLSDGVTNMLGLVSDLVLRCLLLNPEMENPNLSKGIVLIDEIDLHLHPSWQRQVIPNLLKNFPKIQFFITTHSPQVLSSVARESVFVLNQNTILNNDNIYTEGRDSNTILNEVFDILERPDTYSKELKSFYDMLDEENLEQAENILGDLTKKWGVQDSEIMRANLYLSDLKEELAAK